MKLILGMIDIPHSDAGTETTVDIAEDLEKHYQIMEWFYFVHRDDIADDLALSLSDALFGSNPLIDPFGNATSSIEYKFKRFLESQDIEKLGIHGVPTFSALHGISHRFKGKQNWVKKGGKKTFGVRRPSFIDTGQYMNNFKAWIEE